MITYAGGFKKSAHVLDKKKPPKYLLVFGMFENLNVHMFKTWGENFKKKIVHYNMDFFYLCNILSFANASQL